MLRGPLDLSVIPIFATPFGVVPLAQTPKLNPVLEELFRARAAADRGAGGDRADAFCYRSADDLLDWPDDSVRTLAGEALGGIRAVAAAAGGSPEEYGQSLTLQARGWFTILQPDGHVPASTYPLTSWCGIYCVAAPEPPALRRDSGALRLYESRLGTTFTDATTSGMRIPFAMGHFAWRPVPGALAVFPASLTHEIALNRAAGSLVLVTFRVRFLAPGQQGVSGW